MPSRKNRPGKHGTTPETRRDLPKAERAALLERLADWYRPMLLAEQLFCEALWRRQDLAREPAPPTGHYQYRKLTQEELDYRGMREDFYAREDFYTRETA